MNTLATLPDRDAKTPPAKRPFPWEEGEKDGKTPNNENAPKKKRRINTKDKPLKQLWKLVR